MLVKQSVTYITDYLTSLTSVVLCFERFLCVVQEAVGPEVRQPDARSPESLSSVSEERVRARNQQRIRRLDHLHDDYDYRSGQRRLSTYW